MVKHLHYEFNLRSTEIVKVALDQQAYVRLMDNDNYINYKSGLQYRFYGGLAEISPYEISPPSGGHWHLAIDLGVYEGDIEAKVKIIQT